MVWDRETARDLAQEAFLRAYRNLAKFEGGSAFGTWLYAIALNQARSELRRRGAAKRGAPPLSLDAMGGEESSGFDPEDPAPSPAERLGTEEQCAILREEVGRLDPAFREVLVMREFQDLSYEEIAEVTGVPVGTVRSRLHRARRDLAERVRERTGR